LSLVGLITVLLYSGLRLGTRAWEGVEASAERTGGLRLAHNFLTRAVGQARAARVVFDGESRLVFAGDAEGLELVSLLSQHVGIPGLYVLRIRLDEDGQDRRLVLTRWLLHSDVLAGTDEIPAWEPFEGSERATPVGELDQDLAAGAYGSSLLIAGVEDFQLAYYGIAEGSTEPEWHDRWLEPYALPLAVLLRLTTTDQTWPTALIHLPSGE
jgi:general secretion pathway protein J